MYRLGWAVVRGSAEEDRLNKTTRTARARGRKLIAGALRLSILLLVISVLAIVLLGIKLETTPTGQTIAFAIAGAVLQTAVLGLIYEVWLRNDVEDATLEKLGTARDVREHGLIKIGREAGIDWASLLETCHSLCVVTHDPGTLFGRSDDLILRRAREGYLERFTLAVPEDDWKRSEVWLSDFALKWQKSAPGAEFFAVRTPSPARFELINTSSRTVVLLPPVTPDSAVEANKLLEFRVSDPWGMGAWFDRQAEAVTRLTPVIGYSPTVPSDTRGGDGEQEQQRSDRQVQDAANEPEELA